MCVNVFPRALECHIDKKIYFSYVPVNLWCLYLSCCSRHHVCPYISLSFGFHIYKKIELLFLCTHQSPIFISTVFTSIRGPLTQWQIDVLTVKVNIWSFLALDKQANKIGKINLAATGKDLMDDEKQGDVTVDLFAALDMENGAVAERSSELENNQTLGLLIGFLAVDDW